MGTNGVFHLSNRETNGGGILPDLSVVFGAGGDVPLAGRWRQINPCEIDPANNSFFLYRAPIQGNPVEASISPSAGDRKYTVTNIARDPLTETLWMYVPDFQVEKGFGWVQAGWTGDPITKAGTSIAYRSFVGLGVFEVQLPPAEQRSAIQACVDILSDSSAQYPVANVPWRTNNGEQFVPKFTHVPVSAESVCAGIIDGTQKYEIHGFGFFGGDDPPYQNPPYHPGVDFFAPIGSKIYSVADEGIVTSIGLPGTSANPSRSAWRWGGWELDNDVKGYTVIVRYQDLYVLYGHLREIDPSIYVGKKLNAGDLLASIGKYGNPHLHIEVRSFGAAIANDILVKNSNTPQQDNPYGILELQSAQARYVYDIAQFFASDGVEIFTSDTNPTKLNVTGLGKNIAANGVVNVNSCSLTYRLGGHELASGYRGFTLAVPGLAVPHDPTIRTTSPPTYP